jgi:hypothetical protein
MRDRPDGPELLALIRRIEDADPAVSLPADDRYKNLMLAHAKAIADRQAELGGAPEDRELRDLKSLVGGDGGLADLNRDLAAAIRGGDFDSGAARDHLWKTALDRVRESNPKALSGDE